MRDLTFIDIETTGLEPDYHEIIEVAAVRLSPKTLGIVSQLEFKVRPEHPERCEPQAIQKNNYSTEDWKNALPLIEVLQKLTPVLHGSILAGHNVFFDWSFLHEAYRRTQTVNPDVDYHMVDTVSLAWPLVVAGVIEKPTLRMLCDGFSISNEGAHTAGHDVRRTIEVYKHLVGDSHASLFQKWHRLKLDERTIVETIVNRLDAGRSDYGAWRIQTDQRRYPREAFLEILDAMNYCAAELLRLERGALS